MESELRIMVAAAGCRRCLARRRGGGHQSHSLPICLITSNLEGWRFGDLRERCGGWCVQHRLKHKFRGVEIGGSIGIESGLLQ